MEKNEYIFGIRAVMEAIEAGRQIDKVLMRRDLGGDLARELQKMIQEYDVVMQKVPLEKLNRITMKNHQGVVALLSPVEYYRLENLLPEIYEEGRVPKILVLDGITDNRNFGAIARTAECAGFDTIVIPQRNSVTVNADAVKTSAGALLHIPVCREREMAQALKYLKESGCKVIGATEKGVTDYSNVDCTVPIAIVMGSEDTGMSRDVIKLCDELVAIPIEGNIGSLNVSVAAGVMMYEVVRQRRKS